MTSCHYPRPAVRAPVSRIRAALIPLACGAIAACAGAPSHPALRPATPSTDRSGYRAATDADARSNDVLMRAIGLVGTPYRFGGNTPQGGFDCSGLVDFVFLDAAGFDLPRSTRELIGLEAPRVDRDALRPGDLVYFNPGGGPVSHVGIYVGEGRFVHAPSTGGTVRLDLLGSDYWDRAYQGAKRVLR